MNIYQEELTDHYTNPRNRGTLHNPDFTSGMHNPSCGDSVSIQGCVEDGILLAIAFEGKGCVISQATASMLTEYAKGKSLAQLKELNADFMRSLIGMPLGPTRLKCALLPLEALQQGIKDMKD